MLTLQDCIDMCGLDKAEIDAIAEHEHIPEIIAAELGAYLVDHPDGVPRIKKMIVDDIHNAEKRGDTEHVHRLKNALMHIVVAYADIADHKLQEQSDQSHH